jgi:6-phosphofructokinase
VELLGFANGTKGLADLHMIDIREETFRTYRNTGGYDYLAKTADAIRTKEQ